MMVLQILMIIMEHNHDGITQNLGLIMQVTQIVIKKSGLK